VEPVDLTGASAFHRLLPNSLWRYRFWPALCFMPDMLRPGSLPCGKGFGGGGGGGKHQQRAHEELKTMCCGSFSGPVLICRSARSGRDHQAFALGRSGGGRRLCLALRKDEPYMRAFFFFFFFGGPGKRKKILNVW